MRAGADHRGGPGDLFRRRVGAELERAGVQAQQRDPMREDVVHLPRDPRALRVPDLLDAQLLLGLGVARALPARLAAPLAEHAPGDDHRRAERAGEVVRHLGVALRVQDAADR